MRIEPIEVYSSDSNYAIVKPPGRRYPGCVIQGDSLSILCRTAKSIAGAAKEGRTDTEEVLGDIEELANALIERILHYQAVLDSYGIDLPWNGRFTESDLVSLLPAEGEE